MFLCCSAPFALIILSAAALKIVRAVKGGSFSASGEISCCLGFSSIRASSLIR